MILHMEIDPDGLVDEWVKGTNCSAHDPEIMCSNLGHAKLPVL